MSQEATPHDVPLEFTVPDWNPRKESWDDFLRAMERAYAQHLERVRHRNATDQTAPQRDPDDPV